MIREITLLINLMIDSYDVNVYSYLFSNYFSSSSTDWCVSSMESKNALCFMSSSFRKAIESNYFCCMRRFLLYWRIVKWLSYLPLTFLIKMFMSLWRCFSSNSGLPKNINFTLSNYYIIFYVQLFNIVNKNLIVLIFLIKMIKIRHR